MYFWYRYLDGPIADLNNTASTTHKNNTNHTANNSQEHTQDNYQDSDNHYSDTEYPSDLDEPLPNAEFSHTQSNRQETVSGISYTNKNQVNKSGRSKLQEKFYRMSAALCEVVDDYGLVSFHPMNIEDVEVSFVFYTLCIFVPWTVFSLSLFNSLLWL